MNTKQTEARRQVAERIAAPTIGKVAPAVYRELVADMEAALDAAREWALIDAAHQECDLCAGVDGYNPTPVLTAGNYVHRNDPPHGLAGIYCKDPRIRALLTTIRNGE